MLFFHIADLHFGKTLQDKSLLDDQRDWATKFLALVRNEHPNAVVIAGDVYDRATPSSEAVELFDWFLTELVESGKDLTVMVVAGNHDSGQRLAFGADILQKQRLFISGRTKRKMIRVPLRDEHGEVSFWLMPFTFPAAIGQALAVDDIPRDYTGALNRYLASQDVDQAGRNVLVAHQAVTCGGNDPERGGSETMIGGVGSVDCVAYDAFDYVALGHIHKAQSVGRDTVRYAGSPLCYHFDEARWPDKGVVRVELGPKGSVAVDLVKIAPAHPLRIVEGPYADIVANESENQSRGEYVKVVLTDCRVEPEKADSLRALFERKGSHALQIATKWHPFSNASQRDDGAPSRVRSLAEKFADFWRARHGGTDPDDAMLSIIRLAAEQIDSGTGECNDEQVRKLVLLATTKIVKED